MEEVDNIIIDSLRNINCDIDEDIRNLKEFTAEMALESIASCLEMITPGMKFPQKLPPSMSLRLKLATSIAEHIKELGYRDDMGYQTILYCNEVEIRRVLMFLVERLPREMSKTVVTEELGYVPKLVKEIEERIKLSFERPWVPTVILQRGVRDCGQLDLRQDFGYCYPLQTQALEAPKLNAKISEALKHYWVHHLPDVTKQCISKNLVPSLLYNDSEFTTNVLKMKGNFTIIHNANDFIMSKSNSIISNEIMHLDQTHLPDSPEKDKMQIMLTDLEQTKETFKELQEKHKLLSNKLVQMIEERAKKEASLKETIIKVKTRSKTLAVLSNEDNMTKLKKVVETGTKRLVDLANQWYQIQVPLLKQYEELKENLTNQKCKIIDEQQKLQNMKDKHNQLTIEMKEKEKLEQHLQQEYQKLNKNTNRSAYTRRILEIIGNIKKQNNEIQKILKDTKAVQKEINNLNGQLDRSFTLSDELIFRDAKRDEMARKAYKLLATLHSDCGVVVQAVTDLGLTERECRNLQEQVDAELTKGNSVKLEKVNNDLAEVKKEMTVLIKQIKEQT